MSAWCRPLWIWRYSGFSVRVAADLLASGYLVYLLSFQLTVVTYSWTIMSDEESKVPEELFKDVKFYVVGDIDETVRLWTLAYSFLPSVLTSQFHQHDIYWIGQPLTCYRAIGDKQAAVTAYIVYILKVANICVTVLAVFFIENNLISGADSFSMDQVSSQCDTLISIASPSANQFMCYFEIRSSNIIVLVF